MRKRMTTIALVLLVVLGSVAAQEKKPEPQPKLVQFYMALFRAGVGMGSMDAQQKKTAHDAHVAYFEDLVKSGKVVLGGAFPNDADIKGVYVLRAKTSEEAKEWAEGDPLVQAGFLTVEMHPWFSEDVMKPATIPLTFTKAYFAFLTRGAKWTPERTPQTEEIQKAHLANIHRLADMKKLVIAGPFGDDGSLRGIFIFKVGSLEEAKELASSDPAVQAGRLQLDVRTWLVPEGMLP